MKKIIPTIGLLLISVHFLFAQQSLEISYSDTLNREEDSAVDIKNAFWTNATPFVQYNSDSVLSNTVAGWAAFRTSYQAPVPGQLNQAYKKGGHPGLDLHLRLGDSVRPAWPGIVRYVGSKTGGYGNLVVIRHFNGVETFYGHLSKILVNANDTINHDIVLGLGGSTGHSTGPHLHFEIRYHGITTNPLLAVDTADGSDLLVFEKYRSSKKIQVKQQVKKVLQQRAIGKKKSTKKSKSKSVATKKKGTQPKSSSKKATKKVRKRK